jgi:hypothetical protein
MDNFNLDVFVGELTKTFNNKKSALMHTRHLVSWENNTIELNNDDPEIKEIVDSIVRSSTKRWGVEEQEFQMLFDAPGTIQETVDDHIFLALVKWGVGLNIVKTDNHDGINLLLKGIEHLDFCRGILEHEQWQKWDKRKKEQAVHGGKAKAARFAPLKAEVVRLLQEMKPAEGWKNKAAAIKCIDGGLRLFIDRHGWPTSADKSSQSKDAAEQYALIERQVNDWSRDDVDVKAAFDATVKQKNNSAPKGAE